MWYSKKIYEIQQSKTILLNTHFILQFAKPIGLLPSGVAIRSHRLNSLELHKTVSLYKAHSFKLRYAL
jgi:hypothetical protein